MTLFRLIPTPLRQRLHASRWDRRSPNWHNNASEYRITEVRRVLDWFEANAGPVSGQVLDLGCGTGDYSIEAATRGLVIMGTDFSEGMLTRARVRVPEGASCTFRRHDFNVPLPFPDGAFAGALSTWALQHATNLDATLRELRRVLTPGAPVLLVVPLRRRRHGRAPLRLRVRRAVRHFRREVAGGAKRFEREAFLAAVGRNGFTTLAVQDNGPHAWVAARAS